MNDGAGLPRLEPGPSRDLAKCIVDGKPVLDRLSRNLGQEVETIGVDVRPTFTIGWARFEPSRHRDFGQLLAMADHDMYQQKRRQRNGE